MCRACSAKYTSRYTPQRVVNVLLVITGGGVASAIRRPRETHTTTLEHVQPAAHTKHFHLVLSVATECQEFADTHTS